MPPRVLKRRLTSSSSSSTATALERKPPPEKTPVVEDQIAFDHDYHHRRPPRKEENGNLVSIPRTVDESVKLELESNDLRTDAEENGRANVGMEGEGRINGDDTTEAIIKRDEELQAGKEDVQDEHGEELDGFEEEHQDVVIERRKRKEFEVFVGGLDRDATEEDLRKVFSQVGEITELRLLKNPATNKNRGFAFIRFATVDQARRAVNELKHPVVNGKPCGVAPSQDNDTLFVGNICKEWTKEILKEKLSHYGVEKFEELTLIDDLKNEGKNRGFAFLGFSSRADAMEACKCLQKRDVVFGTDRIARVAFANSVTEPDEEIMSQVRKVFIDGLPSTWDEDSVKEHFKKFGRIEKVELARNMPAARRTDFGFITFETHDAAVTCVDGINTAELGYGDKKVKIRARLTRPRQRVNPDKRPRGGYTVGHGGHWDTKASWCPSMSNVDPYKRTDRSGRSTSYSAYDGILKQSVGYREKRTIVDVVPKTVGRGRQFVSSDRPFRQKSPAYGPSISRDYIHEDEYFSGPSDFARAPVKRRSDKHAYSSRGSGSWESSQRTVSHGIPRRMPPLTDDDKYGRYMEQSSSYRDNHNLDYSSFSGSKRPYSAIEEAQPRLRQSGARFDYENIGFLSPYSGGSYGSASARSRHDSHSEYDGGSRRAARHSHEHSDTYASKKIRRGDAEMLYTYGRDHESQDYIPARSELGAGSYSPVYLSGRTNDGYLRRRRSGSYY